MVLKVFLKLNLSLASLPFPPGSTCKNFQAVSAKNMKAMLSKDCDMEVDQNLLDMLNEFIPKAHKARKSYA